MDPSDPYRWVNGNETGHPHKRHLNPALPEACTWSQSPHVRPMTTYEESLDLDRCSRCPRKLD